ncbi:hypothetical protein [Okeania sp. KiyG1]|uniref:hypothetical protein n=1 Tax=Okeania sp. KiyG1 TaxID=2720165 RepID=UPI00192259F8|nr:hypothetical protein [Okeania sp. KiyG1]
MKKEEGRRKKEEGQKEEGRRKKEEGRRKNCMAIVNDQPLRVLSPQTISAHPLTVGH